MPTLAPFPTLFSCGHQLDEAHLGLMREISATLSPEALRKYQDRISSQFEI
jgi:hypothetical protein